MGRLDTQTLRRPRPICRPEVNLFASLAPGLQALQLTVVELHITATRAPVSVAEKMSFASMFVACVVRGLSVSNSLDVCIFLTSAWVKVENDHFLPRRSWNRIPVASSVGKVLKSIIKETVPAWICHARSFYEWLAKNVMRERNEQEIIMNTTYSSIVPMKFWNKKSSTCVLFELDEFGRGPSCIKCRNLITHSTTDAPPGPNNCNNNHSCSVWIANGQLTFESHRSSIACI